MALACWFARDRYRVQRWKRNVFDRLAFVARYAHVPPSESAAWELRDLNDFMQSVDKILREENKPPSRRR